MKEISEKEFSALANFAQKKWGLAIDAKKRVIVQNRIEALRREVHVEDVASLIDTLQNHPDRDLELQLFDVLSTNHTHFFRENEHLDLIKKDLLQPAKSANKRGLRIWSAGCSRGCEPYSLSIILNEIFGRPETSDHRILATDLSTGALAAATRGEYSGIELDGVSEIRKKRYFEPFTDRGRTSYRVDPKLRSVISFGRLNLLEPWPMKGPFDAILCRNVMIYFDDATRKELAKRFLDLVRPGGLLIIGTSESFAGFDLPVDTVASSAYRKRGATE